jgi:hypothetical protein
MLFCVVLLRMRSLIVRVCNFGVVSECDGFIYMLRRGVRP